MSAYADLDDTRTNIITSGTIPDTYLIKPTGTYWDSHNASIAYNFLKSWIQDKDESVPSSLFQNKVNRALFNTATLLEGRVDSLHQVAALVTAKERALGTYNESGYLKKYHDYIISNHNIPNTASGIDTTLNQTLGDMAPLAGEITSIANRAASIAGIPNDLLESDIEYWIDVEIATYCKLDRGVNHPHCTPEAGNQDGIVSGESHGTVSASWYWRAFSCLSTFRGHGVGAVCSGTASGSSSSNFHIDVGPKTVAGMGITSRLTVTNALEGTAATISGTLTEGPNKKTVTGSEAKTVDAGKTTFKVEDVWALYTEGNHPCYSNNYPDVWCIPLATWTFSGRAAITIPHGGTGGGNNDGGNNGGGTPRMEYKPDITTTNPPKFGYIGHTYHYDVDATDANEDTLKYSARIVGKNDPNTDTDTRDVSPTYMIDSEGMLTWIIPNEKKYLGKYDVTVNVNDGTKENNILRSDTLEFELTVRQNITPELTATAKGGVGYNVADDTLDYPDFDPNEATDAKYNRVMWRFGGTLSVLGDPIRYDFRGVDGDDIHTDQTFILSVSEEPTTELAALTDCERNVSELTVYKSGSVITSSEISPITGFACIFALDVNDDGVVQFHGYGSQDAQEFTYGQAGSDFIVQLSDGVADPVPLRIFYSVVDPIYEVWEAGQLLVLSGLNIIDAATTTPIRNVEDLIDFITGEFERFSIEAVFAIGDAFINEFDDNLTMVFRCEIGVFHLQTLDCGKLPEDDDVEKILEYLKRIDVIGGNDVSGQQSEERKPRWTLVANVSNARNVTINDTDIKPNKVYTYVARIFVGDNATDYMPLGSITTPADRAPIIALRGPTTMTISLGSPYVEPGYMALDDYDGNVTDDMTVTSYVDVNREGNYNIFYYASDSAGNLATPQKRIVFVIDDSTPPVLTLKGSKTISMDAGLTYTDPGYSAIDNKDGNITDNVVVTGTVNTRVPDVYTIQYDVSDRVGNKAPTQTRTVTIIGDDTPPVITLKGNKTITIEAGLTYVDPGYTATDNRDGNITDMVVITGTVDTNIPGTYTIQYDVLDSSSNAAIQQIRTVTVVDTIPPTLTLKGGSSITIPASTPYVEPGYTATDNTDGNVRVEIVGWVNTNQPGSYSIQYTAYDSSDNKAPPQIRMIIVEDVTPPVITLKGNSSITVPASIPYTDPGYTAIDNIDGDITGRVVISGMVDTDTLGDYTIYYDVSDWARNAAIQQNRTVTVADLTPPILTLKGGDSITVPVSMPYVEPGYTAIDNIDGNLTENVVITGHIDTDVPGTYTLHYDVWDAAFNIPPTQNRTIIVADMTPPVITLKGNSSITVPASIPYTDPGYTAIDNIDGDITGRVVISGMVDTDTLGDYTIYYDVSDWARNAAIQQNRTVTVVDLTPPVITLTGNATVTIPMGPTYTDPGYTATDNIDGDITSMVTISGTVNPLIPGIYTISYTVTDTADNTKQQDRVVTVSPPTDTTLYCNDMTLAQLMASGKYNIINKMFSSDSNIKGTNKADLIIVGNNGPTIEGKDGDDCIIGGSGNDTILGQVGNDMMFGNDGNDEIRGGDNKDTIYGGAGNDELHGGSGHDTIYGEGGADEIHGGAGNDTIYGGSEDDKILGLNGNDTIYGEAGNDTIYAGPGNDTIYGGPGTDTIDAGETDTVHDDDDDDE